MRTKKRSWLCHTSAVLLVVMSACSVAPPVQGGLVPSQAAAVGGAEPADLAKMQQVIEQKAVTERLAALGFTQDEIQQRMQRLSDAEIHQFVQQSDALVAGGEGVIGVLLIVVLVLLILKLL